MTPSASDGRGARPPPVLVRLASGGSSDSNLTRSQHPLFPHDTTTKRFSIFDPHPHPLTHTLTHTQRHTDTICPFVHCRLEAATLTVNRALKMKLPPVFIHEQREGDKTQRKFSALHHTVFSDEVGLDLRKKHYTDIPHTSDHTNTKRRHVTQQHTTHSKKIHYKMLAQNTICYPLPIHTK